MRTAVIPEKITPRTPRSSDIQKLNVRELQRSDNACLAHLGPQQSAPAISEMNKTSYQTFKVSPAELEVTIPFKTQPFLCGITIRVMFQGTKKNRKGASRLY